MPIGWRGIIMSILLAPNMHFFFGPSEEMTKILPSMSLRSPSSLTSHCSPLNFIPWPLLSLDTQTKRQEFAEGLPREPPDHLEAPFLAPWLSRIQIQFLIYYYYFCF